MIAVSLGALLFLNYDTKSKSDINDSPLKEVNDNLVNILQKHPSTYKEVNSIINTSPFLSAQKAKFLEKHYGKKANNELNERLLNLYLTSQNGIEKERSVKLKPGTSLR
jgi:hypothetical protein